METAPTGRLNPKADYQTARKQLCLAGSGLTAVEGEPAKSRHRQAMSCRLLSTQVGQFGSISPVPRADLRCADFSRNTPTRQPMTRTLPRRFSGSMPRQPSTWPRPIIRRKCPLRLNRRSGSLRSRASIGCWIRLPDDGMFIQVAATCRGSDGPSRRMRGDWIGGSGNGNRTRAGYETPQQF